MKKTLSIIVPSYNTQDYIDECLPTLLGSDTNDSVEIILVNDGSTDSTREKAEQYASLYPNTVRVVNKENGGHGSCLNVGIRVARGRYFRVVDGDDWVDEIAFSNYVNYLENADSDIVICDYAIRFVNTRRTKTIKYGMGTGAFDFNTVASKIKQITIQSMTIRTSILRENDISFTENCFYEDSEFILYPLMHVKRISFVDCCVYQYRMGASSQSVNIKNVVRNREMLHQIMISLIEFGQQERTRVDESVCQYLDSVVVSRIQNYYGLILKMPYGNEAKHLIDLVNHELKEKYPVYYELSNNGAISLLRKHNDLTYPAAYLAFGVKRFIRGF